MANMYSVFIKNGAAQGARPYIHGEPVGSGNLSEADTHLLATREHSCAMHIKQTIDGMGKFLRGAMTSPFLSLLGWAKNDADTVGVDHQIAQQVAKAIWHKWLETRVHNEAHRAKALSDRQLLSLASTYVQMRAGEFMYHGKIDTPEQVEALTVPIGNVQMHGQQALSHHIGGKLHPQNTRVRKLTQEEIDAHIQHPTGDSRFIRLVRK